MKTVLGLWDLHYPYHEPAIVDIFHQFAKDYSPDIVILGGDNMNCGAASSHRPSPKEMLKAPLDKEREGFDREILQPIDKLKPDEKVLFIGNHEMWLQDKMNQDPSLGNDLDFVKRLNLKERGWKIIPYKKYYHIGKLCYHHGDWRQNRKGASGGAKHHAMAGLARAGRSVRYGHMHTFQVFTDVKEADKGIPFNAMCIPCGCKLNQAYTEGGQTAWLNGLYLGFIRDNGDFSDYVLTVIKNKITYAGKTYEAFK